MKRKRLITYSVSAMGAFAAILSSFATAEGPGLESVNKQLAEVEKVIESAQKSTEVLQAPETAGKTAAEQGGLTEILMSKLGITEEQAQGGAGAIFLTAKGKLDEAQFTELGKSVPEMETLLNAVPKQSSSLTGLTGEVSERLGDDAKDYGNLSEMAMAFKELKLSPDKVVEFVPVVVDYVRTSGGDSTADMLQSALYGI